MRTANVFCMLAKVAALALVFTSAAGRAGAQEADPSETDLVRRARRHLKPEFLKDGKPDTEAIMKHLDDLYRAESSISRMTLTVTKPRRTRTLRMKTWSKGTERALLVIESPAREKGTATLKVEKNLWNYLPRIARTIRIPPSMMLSSWMGSDFTNDDLVRESSFTEDYDVKVSGYVRVKGREVLPVAPAGAAGEPGAGEGKAPGEGEGWLVDLTAKEGVVGLWKRIEYVLSPDATIPLLARFYDRKGRLSRLMEFDDVRDFPVGADRDGKPEGGYKRIPARMVLTPLDREGRQTVAVYDEMRFDVDVPDDTFSLSRLERKR